MALFVTMFALAAAEERLALDSAGPVVRVWFTDLDPVKLIGHDATRAEDTKRFPKWLRNLDGKRIIIRGVMYPAAQLDGNKAFGLAANVHIVDFGRNPKLHEIMPVFLWKGTTTRYTLRREIDVVGTLHIDPQTEEDKLILLYRLEDAAVIELCEETLADSE